MSSGGERSTTGNEVGRKSFTSRTCSREDPPRLAKRQWRARERIGTLRERKGDRELVKDFAP